MTSRGRSVHQQRSSSWVCEKRATDLSLGIGRPLEEEDGFCCYLVTKLCLTILWPHGLWPARLLCPCDFPGKNTGVGCHFLLHRIFPTQGSHPSLLHCRQILYHWPTREVLRFQLDESTSMRWKHSPRKNTFPWNLIAGAHAVQSSNHVQEHPYRKCKFHPKAVLYCPSAEAGGVELSTAKPHTQT